MGRTKQRTEHSMPQFAAALKTWGMTQKSATRVLQINLPDDVVWRVLRCDAATPKEIETVEGAILAYGRKYNLPGWRELQ